MVRMNGNLVPGARKGFCVPRCRIGVAVAVLLCGALFVSPASGQKSSKKKGPDPEARCLDLQRIKVEDVNLLSSAVIEPTDDLPAHCRVLGFVRPEVNFELRLPLKGWVEKFYMVGCGGFCGRLDSDLPGFTNAMNHGLRRGYAAATMDGGHWGHSRVDGTWAFNNRRAEIDFGHRAVHAVAEAAKAIIKSYYDEDLRYSFFAGCSTGGRMGLMEAQRYPEDFDGIIAGAPALDYTALVGSLFAWLVQANRDQDGNQILLAPKTPLIADAVYAACDAKDGLKDGILSDPSSCEFDPETLVCSDKPMEACLSPEEAQVAASFYTAPVNAIGDRLYPSGLPFGSEPYWPLWVVGKGGMRGLVEIFNREFLRYMAFDQDPGELFDPSEFDFDRDPPEMERLAAIYNAVSPDLERFRKRGGRLLIYHGWADAIVPPQRTITYFEDMTSAMGGPDEVSKFARMFLVPGMDHCGIQKGRGPDHFDPLAVLEDWIEQNKMPDSIVAQELDTKGKVTRSRPLCPYPKVAKYRGSGSHAQASSFRCEEP